MQSVFNLSVPDCSSSSPCGEDGAFVWEDWPDSGIPSVEQCNIDFGELLSGYDFASPVNYDEVLTPLDDFKIKVTKNSNGCDSSGSSK